MHHFQRVGLGAGTRLETIDDLDKLEAILANIEAELKEGRNGVH